MVIMKVTRHLSSKRTRAAVVAQWLEHKFEKLKGLNPTMKFLFFFSFRLFIITWIVCNQVTLEGASLIKMRNSQNIELLDVLPDPKRSNKNLIRTG